MSSVRKSLDSNENQGVNVSDAKRTLERAREASLEGRYEEAEQMAREADDLGRLLLSQYNEYQSLRVKAMAMITNGLEGNERVQELIAEADGRASGGDYRRGIDALEKAVEITVEDMSGSEPADQAQPARVVKEVVSRKRKVVADAVTEEGAEGTLDEEVTFEEVVSEEVVEAGDETPVEAEAEASDGSDETEEPGEPHCPYCGAALVVRTSIRPTIVRCASCQSSVTLR